MVNAKTFGPQSLTITSYSQLVKDDKNSEDFLKQNPDLLTEETIQILIDWCLSEDVNNV